jgi:hypothetical protein
MACPLIYQSFSSLSSTIYTNLDELTLPPAAHSNERGAENFIKLINNFHQKYKVQARKTFLSESEKENFRIRKRELDKTTGEPLRYLRRSHFPWR